MKLIDAQKKYYKGNTHTHSTNSDGVKSPEEVMRLYADHGYDFMALTDHWAAAPTQKFENMLVLTGTEFDFDFGNQVLHVVALFPNEEAAQGFSGDMDYKAVIARINAVGGCAIAAHPSWSLNTPEFLKNLEGVCAVEVYNSFSGEPWNAPRADSSQVLDITAAAGRCIPQVAADDSHFYQGEQCLSYIMLQADALTPEDVIAALKRGSFYASQGPKFLDAELNGDTLTLRTSPVSKCMFASDAVWIENRCRVGTDMTEHVYRIHPKEGYIRCEITDAQGRKAWLSPVKLK